jgi:serine/threonine-protein kinase RsbT
VREMGFGAGMGLSNMKKNTDKLDIQSIINKGTIVEMVAYTEQKNR